MAECVKDPLAPITATRIVPALRKVHERVDAPEPVTIPGFTTHRVLLVVRLTRPVKPFRPATVIADVPTDLAFTITLVGPDVMT